jgi:hypothetical protein
MEKWEEKKENGKPSKYKGWRDKNAFVFSLTHLT